MSTLKGQRPLSPLLTTSEASTGAAGPFAPKLPGPTPFEATASGKPKRRHTSQACDYCRSRRRRVSMPPEDRLMYLNDTPYAESLFSQCDGNPRCQSCIDAHEECVYHLDDKRTATVRRQSLQALEDQNEQLRSTLDVLKHGSDEDALAALLALRSRENAPDSILPVAVSLDYLSIPTSPSLSSDDLDRIRADVDSRQPPAQSLDWSMLRRSGYPTIFTPQQLPPEAVVRTGGEFFFGVIAGLFHIMTMDEFDQLFKEVYRSGSTPEVFLLAQLCAVTAIGAHYNLEDSTVELKDALFNTAVQYIPEMIERGDLRTMKFLACLVAYGVVDKRTSTRQLIQLNLQIARVGLALPDRSPSEVCEWRRLYRTAMFFEWLVWLGFASRTFADLTVGCPAHWAICPTSAVTTSHAPRLL